MSTTLSRRYDAGDLVVHPRHGTGEVVRRLLRRTEGSVREYLEIELTHKRLRILVPCDTAEAIGLRPIVDQEQLREIVEVLESAPETPEASALARQRRYREQLRSGDVLQLAAVIRDLASRAEAKPLSPPEKALSERSNRVLASELCFVLDVDTEHAGAYIAGHVPNPLERTR